MNYEDLRYLPAINGVTLINDLRFEDLGLVSMSVNDINEIMLEVFGYIL